MGFIPRVCRVCGASFMAANRKVKQGGGLYCSNKCSASIRIRTVTFTCETCRAVITRSTRGLKDAPRFCSLACRRQKIRCICVGCGAEVERTRSQVMGTRAIYCSVACRRNKVTETCKHCGVVYDHRKSTQRGGYCSLQCYKAAGIIEQQCKHCSEPFQTFRSKGNRHCYCSRECHIAATASPPVQTVCICCGNTFTVRAYVIRNKQGHYCSRTCRIKHKRGENASNWRGGWRSYYGPNWNQAKKDARKRAGYCCEQCGIHQSALRRALDVHHKIPVRCFTNPDDAHFSSNLMALCPTCHVAVEHEGYDRSPLFSL
jgi:hypothetical protein